MKRPLPQTVTRPDVIAAIRASLPELPARVESEDADRIYRACSEAAIFKLCRFLKGMPHLSAYSPEDLKPVVSRWCQEAAEIVGPLDEIVMMAIFVDGWPKVRHPILQGCANPLQEAASRAWVAGPVPELDQQDLKCGPQLVRIAKVMRELQRMAGPGNLIFLSERVAASLIGRLTDPIVGRRLLDALERIDLIERVKRGGPRRATRYRYLGKIESFACNQPSLKVDVAPAAPLPLPAASGIPAGTNPISIEGVMVQSASEFRSSRDWRHAALVYLQEHPRCECADAHPGDPPMANHVHHRQGLETPEGWARRLDPRNFRSVCKACHLRLHSQVSSHKGAA